LQFIGLALALAWSIGLVVLFVVVEVLGVGSGDLLDILRELSPGGIIFMLASLIAVIGALTRLGRG
jgi:di/tricarboxylate transporter